MTLTAMRPNGQEISLSVYLDIFSLRTWLSLLGAILALATGLYLIGALGSERFHGLGDSEGFTWLNAVSLEVILLMQRDYCVTKARVSSRIIFQSSCLFCFVVFSFYTGVLTSLMTSRRPPAPITELRQVLTSPAGYRVLLKEGTSHVEFVRTSPRGSPLREIYETMVEGKEGEEVYVQSRADARDRLYQDSRNLYFGSKMYLFGIPGLVGKNILLVCSSSCFICEKLMENYMK